MPRQSYDRSKLRSHRGLLKNNIQSLTAVVPEPGGPGGPLAPPIFGRSVNPTGEGRLSPPITTGTPNVFHLPALLGR